MAHIDSEYKLGDIVMYNGNRYRVTAVRRLTTNIAYTIWDYEYDLFLIREPREGERSIIKGVNERLISRNGKVDFIENEKYVQMYFPGYKFDPKFIEHMYPVKSSLSTLDELYRREVEGIAASPIRIEIDDAIKANYSKEVIKKMINNTFGKPVAMFNYQYKKIIFNGPCTIILWKDGTKTIAKTSGGEVFDPEKGVAVCFMKKMLGHTETNKVLRKAHKQYEDYLTENGIYPTLDLKDLHALEPTEYRLNFVNPIARVSDINPNSVICIDQSAIEEVKKVEEEQDESK